MVTIEKNRNAMENKIRVRFSMPPIDGCDCLYLVGRFYPWNESTYRMRRADDGMWSLTLDLESGREFQYRFRTNDGTWLTDASTPQVHDLFGSEFSVVSTSAKIPFN